jgi:hypothetical protein
MNFDSSVTQRPALHALAVSLAACSDDALVDPHRAATGATGGVRA